MTDKERYRELCREEVSIPVYSRDWWLDCVCGEANWDVLLSTRRKQIEAAMPYYIHGKGVISMPPYTQTMGVWFNPAFCCVHYHKELYRKQTICKNFIERLPAHDYFYQQFHYSFTDWLPFYWNGFSQTTRYTYVFPDIGNPDELLEEMNRNIRRNIQRAKNHYQLTVRRNVPVDIFLKVSIQTYQRQGMKPYQPELLKRLIAVSRSRKQGDIWGTYDENDRLFAAVFIVWQENCAYYIAGGYINNWQTSGGLALSIWTAINDLSGQVRSFDFEGSMIQGIEDFFRGFGALQQPYFAIEKGELSLLTRKKLSLFQKVRTKFFNIIKIMR
ncbi:MAG: GNAT family N-acetyltransferase [Dysgonamonadaceae bacterium]|jgi:hypothetical protein|nr:GNAT family N-acetyltransferase [Dysgonamonadaceae bacterium]